MKEKTRPHGSMTITDMKKANEIINRDKKTEPSLSRRFERMCIEWAIEAYKIDSSKTLREYQKLFLDRAKSKYYRQVFDDGAAIEV